jgi:hypothetical protein
MNELPPYGLINQPPARDWELNPPRNEEEYYEYMNEQMRTPTMQMQKENDTVELERIREKVRMEEALRREMVINSLGGVFMSGSRLDDTPTWKSPFDQYDSGSPNPRQGLFLTPEIEGNMIPRDIPTEYSPYMTYPFKGHRNNDMPDVRRGWGTGNEETILGLI